jgi:putative MFS transporter
MDGELTLLRKRPSSVVDSLDMVQRIDRLPATKYFYIIAMVAGAGIFFDLFGINSLSFTIAAIRQVLKLSPMETSLTLVMVFIGMVFGSLIFGRLAESFGRKPMFRITVVIISVGSFLTFLGMFWPNLCYIWFSRLITGLGAGGNLPVIWSYAIELVPSRLRGRAFGVATLVGAAFTNLLGTFLAKFLLNISLKMWGYEFLAGALIAFIVLPLSGLIPESPRWYMSRGDIQAAEVVLIGIETRVQREYGKSLPTYERPATPYVMGVQKAPMRELFAPDLLRTTILMIFWFVTYTLAFYGWQSFYTIFIVAKGYSVTHTADLAFAASLFSPLGPIVGTYIADKLERRYQLMIYAGIMGSVVLVIAWAPALDPLILGLITINGLALSAWAIPMYTFVPEVFPARVRATGAGLSNACGRAANVIGVMVVGVVLAGTLTGQLIWIAANWSICIVIMAIMGFRTTGRALEEITECKAKPPTSQRT